MNVKILVSQNRLAALHTLLSSEETLEEPLPSIPTGMQSGVSASEAHLTDVQFVDYCLQSLPAPERRLLETHLHACTLCRLEVARLESLATFWTEGVAVERLQARLNLAQGTSIASQTLLDLIRILPASLRTTLALVTPPRGAYGAGAPDETHSLTFPVLEGDQPVPGLTGSLQRRDQEYYSRVYPITAQAEAAFGPRQVQLYILDLQTERLLLQRSVDVGVTVLLGTGLPLTEHCQLVAQLVPTSSWEDMGD